MSHWNCVERPMSRFFGAYGRLVASSPWPFIVIPLIVTATLSLGFLHMDIITDAVYLFVPTNSIAKYERLVIHEKWPLIQNTYLPGRAVTQTRECQVWWGITRARWGVRMGLLVINEMLRNSVLHLWSTLATVYLHFLGFDFDKRNMIFCQQ